MQARLFPDREDQLEFERARDRIGSRFGARDVLTLYRPSEPQTLEIVEYLSKYSFLVPQLLASAIELRRVFGHDNAYLELVADPDSGREHLFLVVTDHRDAETVVSLLHRLDQEWYLGLPKRSRLLFTVTVDRDDSSSV